MSDMTPRQLVLTIAQASRSQRLCLQTAEEAQARGDQQQIRQSDLDWLDRERQLLFWREELHRVQAAEIGDLFSPVWDLH